MPESFLKEKTSVQETDLFLSLCQNQPPLNQKDPTDTLFLELLESQTASMQNHKIPVRQSGESMLHWAKRAGDGRPEENVPSNNRDIFEVYLYSIWPDYSDALYGNRKMPRCRQTAPCPAVSPAAIQAPAKESDPPAWYLTKEERLPLALAHKQKLNYAPVLACTWNPKKFCIMHPGEALKNWFLSDIDHTKPFTHL